MLTEALSGNEYLVCLVQGAADGARRSVEKAFDSSCFLN